MLKKGSTFTDMLITIHSETHDDPMGHIKRDKCEVLTSCGNMSDTR